MSCCSYDRRNFCSYPRCDWAPNKYDYQLSDPRYSGYGNNSNANSNNNGSCCVGGINDNFENNNNRLANNNKGCGCGCSGNNNRFDNNRIDNGINNRHDNNDKFYRGNGNRSFFRYGAAAANAERFARNTRLDRYYCNLDPLRGRIFAGGFDQPYPAGWDGDELG